ncbi:MAG: hypothetical protein LBV49_04245 [Azonexus sp.]|jgi:hypothetical protein|nr:hypothetical protein [Azonexus sp.]
MLLTIKHRDTLSDLTCPVAIRRDTEDWEYDGLVLAACADGTLTDDEISQLRKAVCERRSFDISNYCLRVKTGPSVDGRTRDDSWLYIYRRSRGGETEQHEVSDVRAAHELCKDKSPNRKGVERMDGGKRTRVGADLEVHFCGRANPFSQEFIDMTLPVVAQFSAEQFEAILTETDPSKINVSSKIE